MDAPGHELAAVEADIARKQARAELRRADREAAAAVKFAERAAKIDEKRQRQAVRVETARIRREAKAQRRAERAAAVAAFGSRLRPVAPLLLVTGFAVFGQVGYGFDNYTTAATPWALRMVIAVGAAIAVESIANYVQWHAHDAQLNKATATAARLRRGSYLIALGVAGVNYAHFAGPGLAPTPGAIVFALFSASQPWLWGLHTRRALHMQLLEEGNADSVGAAFSAERWRSFPLRTFQARRYSIDRCIDDPRQAWEEFRVVFEARQAARSARWAGLLDAIAARRAARKRAKANKKTTNAGSTAAPKQRSRRDDVAPAPAVTAPNPTPELEQDDEAPAPKPQLRAVPKPGSAAEWAINNYPCTWEQVVEATGCGRATAFRAISTAKEASSDVA